MFYNILQGQILVLGGIAYRRLPTCGRIARNSRRCRDKASETTGNVGRIGLKRVIFGPSGAVT